jgi:hypothetical protein
VLQQCTIGEIGMVVRAVCTALCRGEIALAFVLAQSRETESGGTKLREVS